MEDREYRVCRLQCLRSNIVGNVIAICMSAIGATVCTIAVLAALASWIGHDLWLLFLTGVLLCSTSMPYFATRFWADLNELVKEAASDASRPVFLAAKEESHGAI